MLTRLIVDVYAWIIEISLWFLLLISGVTGYHYTVPALKAAGLILDNEAAGRTLGALVFASAAFLMATLLIGPFLVLVDIRKSIRVLETKSGHRGSELSPAMPTEPLLRDGLNHA